MRTTIQCVVGAFILTNASVRADENEPVEVKAHKSEVWCLAFSPDGGQFASAGKDATVQLRGADGAEQHILKGHTGDVLRIAYSPDGKILASAGADGTVRHWNTKNGEELRKIKAHGNWVAGIAFSGDGLRFATASADKTAAVWEVATGNRSARSKVTSRKSGASPSPPMESGSPRSARIASSGRGTPRPPETHEI